MSHPNRKHGKEPRRLYEIWKNMRRRCYDPKTPKYQVYGARGIAVCGEWRFDFVAFRDWALANGYRENLTLDRKDSNGPYSPGNCRWATQMEQQNNRRNNHLIEYHGEVHTLAEWGRITGIEQYTIRRRIRDGWTIEDAMTKEVRGRA